MSSEVDNGVKLFASLLRAIRNVYEFRKGLYDFVRGIVGAPRCLRNVLLLFGRQVGAYLVQIVLEQSTVQEKQCKNILAVKILVAFITSVLTSARHLKVSYNIPLVAFFFFVQFILQWNDLPPFIRMAIPDRPTDILLDVQFLKKKREYHASIFYEIVRPTSKRIA